MMKMQSSRIRLVSHRLRAIRPGQPASLLIGSFSLRHSQMPGRHERLGKPCRPGQASVAACVFFLGLRDQGEIPPFQKSQCSDATELAELFSTNDGML